MSTPLPDLIARVETEYRHCRLCPHACGINRLTQDPAPGAFCRLGETAYVYKELLSLGEEAVISPTWLLDLGGCSLRCLFCTEWAHVVEPRAAPAVPLDPQWFRQRLALRRQQGARTVSFVGGDPTVSLLGVLRALQAVPADEMLPVVWNANGLLGDVAREVLAQVVDTWVLDVKFGNSACAKRISGEHGFDAAEQPWLTLRWLLRPSAHNERVPQVVVRHLVMPGHVDCCTLPVLNGLAVLQTGLAGDRLAVNLMTLFLPAGPAAKRIPATPELSRLATKDEVARAVGHARATLGLWGLDGDVR